MTLSTLFVSYDPRKSHKTQPKLGKTMVGQKKLSGNQEEVRIKVSLCLCKYVSPKTGSITNRLKAYAQVPQELGQLGVSPRYVGDIWRRHKDAIVDSLKETILRSHSSIRRYQEDPDASLLNSYMHGLGRLNGIFAKTFAP
jgi:hypothetical protein